MSHSQNSSLNSRLKEGGAGGGGTSTTPAPGVDSGKVESLDSYLEAASCLTYSAEVPPSSSEQAEEAVQRETRLSGLHGSRSARLMYNLATDCRLLSAELGCGAFLLEDSTNWRVFKVSSPFMRALLSNRLEASFFARTCICMIY